LVAERDRGRRIEAAEVYILEAWDALRSIVTAPTPVGYYPLLVEDVKNAWLYENSRSYKDSYDLFSTNYKKFVYHFSPRGLQDGGGS